MLSSQVAIFVPVVLSLWSRALWGGEEMNRGAVRSSSILEPTAANGSITLRAPVTKPHAMEQRPLPDSANYSDPLRGTNAAPADGRTEVCSLACLVKGDKTYLDADGFFFCFWSKGRKRVFKVSKIDNSYIYVTFI